MAKGLPYFKFTPTEWLTGDICFEDFEVQGLFINICALYWQRDGKVSLEDIEKRYKKPTALSSLIDRFILVNDGFISIKFLNEQLVERKHISTINSENGAKGGRPKTLITKDKKPTANRPLTKTKPKESQEEKEEELEKEEDSSVFNFKSELIKKGGDKKLVEDWLLVRKNKKGTNTETALNGFLLEVEKSKKNINEVLEICVVNSWMGFRVDWLSKIQPINNEKPDLVYKRVEL